MMDKYKLITVLIFMLAFVLAIARRCDKDEDCFKRKFCNSYRKCVPRGECRFPDCALGCLKDIECGVNTYCHSNVSIGVIRNNITYGACLTVKNTGDACVSQRECIYNNECYFNKCANITRKLKPIDKQVKLVACAKDSDCNNSGLYCPIGQAETRLKGKDLGKCRERLIHGLACTRDGECLINNMCHRNQCYKNTTQYMRGKPCASTKDCFFEDLMYCAHSTLWTCANRVEDYKQCYYDFECLKGRKCVQWRQNREHCIPPPFIWSKPRKTCTHDSQCLYAQKCHHNECMKATYTVLYDKTCDLKCNVPNTTVDYIRMVQGRSAIHVFYECCTEIEIRDEDRKYLSDTIKNIVTRIKEVGIRRDPQSAYGNLAYTLGGRNIIVGFDAFTKEHKGPRKWLDCERLPSSC
ncbi:unnamed protein product [Owenia fusiformis]|uniref:Dickkopf N-terminal cysteine-rich domain-containing protein n=1 Tax=Owenia fusiformis TaxID=6347 RepID=A0A8S4P5A4_OWEFU|nr:unnamed protein product [Owenia fusiformis]